MCILLVGLCLMLNFHISAMAFSKNKTRFYATVIAFQKPYRIDVSRCLSSCHGFHFQHEQVPTCQCVEKSVLLAILLSMDTLQYITSISHPSPCRQPPLVATRPPCPIQQQKSAYLGEKDREDIKSVSIIF